MKTLAAVLSEINKPLEVKELLLPELKAGQVLVKVAYSGICRSQLNEIQGLKGEDRFLPHTLGHEGSGTVEAVGAGVEKVGIGDQVVLTWLKGSGTDAGAAVYKTDSGTAVNSGPISTFLTKAVISENRLVKIPGRMPLREAALLGCAIPTGAGIIMNTIKMPAAGSIAIFGMGGIGLSALLAAKMRGATVIIAVDVIEEKLKEASRLGATHVIEAQKEDSLASIMKITSHKGVDYSIECAGSHRSMELAFRCVKENGGLCVIAGNLPKGSEISIDPFGLIKGKRIIGSWGGESNPDKDIPLYAELYLAGKLKLEDLISRHYKLERINEGVADLSRGGRGRILVEMGAK